MKRFPCNLQKEIIIKSCSRYVTSMLCSTKYEDIKILDGIHLTNLINQIL